MFTVLRYFGYYWLIATVPIQRSLAATLPSTFRHRGLTGCEAVRKVNRKGREASLDSQREHAREMLAAVRARLELVSAADPSEVNSRQTVRESLAFVRALHRYGIDFFEED